MKLARRSAVTAQVLAHIVRASSYNGARRALALGPTGSRWLPVLRKYGFEASVLEDVSSPRLAENSFDLVVAVDVLQYAEWDRWVLQHIHQALTDRGHLLLAVPNLAGFTSPNDVIFFGERVIRRACRSLGKDWKAQSNGSLGARKYRRADLISVLESLGYTVEGWSPQGFGWLTPFAGLHPTLAASLARNYVMLCRRRPSLFGLDSRRPYPDPDVHRSRFEQARRILVEKRDRWVDAHPSFSVTKARPFDPEQYRGARVLVLAPHPDDEIIGCGGTLARLVSEGARITVIHATDGGDSASLKHAPASVRRTVRLSEARAVGEMMGFESLVFWEQQDGAFRERHELVKQLVDCLADDRPALIFTPFITDMHLAHRVLSRMLAKAIRACSDAVATAQVLNYEVWALVPPNLYCDVTDVAALQQKALLRYATAMKAEDYVHFCEARNYYHACTLAGRPGFVEAFFQLPARDYVDVVATDERLDR